MKASHTRKPLHQQSAEHTDKPFFSKSPDEAKKKDGAFFQTKLALGEKDDKHEKQANAVANKVQKKAEEEKEKPAVQKQEEEKKEPGVQKMANKEEEKPVQKASVPDKKEEEKPVQKQSATEEEKPVQKAASEEKKEDTPGVQKKEMGDSTAKHEHALQTKSAALTSDQSPSRSLEERIKQRKGKGQTLPDDVRKRLEHELGADFSQVVIHTDSEAIAMNQELKSLAFTNGFDIFFNMGQYQPYTLSGQKLLAHELTHVIQQMGVSRKK